MTWKTYLWEAEKNIEGKHFCRCSWIRAAFAMPFIPAIEQYVYLHPPIPKSAALARAVRNPSLTVFFELFPRTLLRSLQKEGGIMKRVLVTGAGGFIGHHLVSFLKGQGHWVRGVDIEYPRILGH